jgi:hypothetical protein
MDAGGEVTAVYRNKLGLRAEKSGLTDERKMADPTRKNDIGESDIGERTLQMSTMLIEIEFYTNPKKFGYLAQKGLGGYRAQESL